MKCHVTNDLSLTRPLDGPLAAHRASFITAQLALNWAQQPATVQPATWARRLSFVRGFARYRSATDPRTEIPPDALLPHRARHARPYLYSAEEIRRLLRATLAWSGWAKLRPWTYYCLFGLLSVSGLRLGEARNLQLSDVDLGTGVLTIRGAKFGKSRLVPIHASTCQVLAEYLARRQRHWAGRSVSSYVFVTDRGNRLDIGDIRKTFHTVRRIAVSTPSNADQKEIQSGEEAPPGNAARMRTTFELPLNNAPVGATGERRQDSGRLLTVEEVAGLLHVHVSWVYGRMRKRC
jgi:integrase